MITLRRKTDIAVVGAGLVGSLLSIFLAKRRFAIDIFERRPDMRKEAVSAGRSINLAVSTRGIHALKRAGLDQDVLNYAVPMRGRMIHAIDGQLAYQPYGKDDSEYINSISRADLNKSLITHAEETRLVDIYFNQKCTGMDIDKGIISLFNEPDNQHADVVANIVIGTDGSASAIRQDMNKLANYECTESELDYGYKELVIPAGANGAFQIEKNALHIWPRGTFMLIALPNFDGSFTCTLFLPWEGPNSFEKLKTPEDVAEFFQEQFADAVPLLSDLEQTFFDNPTGHMVTVKCNQWNVEERVLLLGDAAHAIVPFFGQGMNAGFEDLTILDQCIDNHIAQGGALYINRRSRESETDTLSRRIQEGSSGWAQVFDDFVMKRKVDTDAIADMAVENFIEMRDKVGIPKFLLEKAVEKILQKEFPGSYLSRYSLVTFSNVPYSFAMKAGIANDEVLAELCANITKPEEVDLKRAQTLLKAKVAPLLEEHSEELFASAR
ncbi:NAD(P)/FAD-dependent oxidoreductase [soil metagenome]